MPNAAVIASMDATLKSTWEKLIFFFILNEAITKSSNNFRFQGCSVNQYHPTVMTFNHPVPSYIDLLLHYTGF